MSTEIWSRRLQRAHRNELKTWRPEEDDAMDVAWLLKRCEDIQRDLDTRVDLPLSAWRRCVVAVALLRAQLDDFPEAFEPVLLRYLDNATSSALMATRLVFEEIFALMPGERGHRWRARWLGRALEAAIENHRAIFDEPDVALLREIPDARELLLTRIKESLRPTSAHWYEGDRVALLNVFQALDGDDAEAPEVVDPLIRNELYDYTRNSPWGSSAIFSRVLRWVPLERREAILLGIGVQAWAFCPTCPTAPVIAMAMRAVSVLTDVVETAPDAFEDMFAELGEVVSPILRARLDEEASPNALTPAVRRIFMRALARHGRAEDLPRFVSSLTLETPQDVWLSMEVLVAPGAESVVDELTALAQSDGEQEAVMAWGWCGAADAQVSSPAQRARWILCVRRASPRQRTPGEAFAAVDALLSAHQWSQEQWQALGSERRVGKGWRAWLLHRQRLAGALVNGLKTDYTYSPLFRSGTHNALWVRLWPLIRHDEQALSLALIALELPQNRSPFPQSVVEVLNNLVGDFGLERVLSHVSHVLESREHRNKAQLYEWACASRALPKALHLKMLATKSKVLREVAAHQLAQVTEGGGPDEVVVAMLSSRRAQERVGAALYFKALASERALTHIEAALDGERSKAVRVALEAARECCDPVRRRLASVGHDYGAYQAGRLLKLSDGLTALRELMYGPTTRPNWVRLCDVLQRFWHVDALDVALDYVREHDLERWSLEDRIRPWGWERHAGLAALAPTETRPWAPVSVIMDDRAGPFFDAVLPSVEKGRRARRMNREVCRAAFAKGVEAAWAWCEAQKIPLSALDVRADGGAVRRNYMTKASTTALDLHEGFGVSLARVTAMRVGDGAPAGLSRIRVSLPAGHPAREAHKLGRRKRHLDLRPVLAL